MNKILVAIPIIVNSDVAREAINQVVLNLNVTVLLCSNGGGPEIEQLLNEFKHLPNVITWIYEKNIYVNPVWNKFLDFFIQSSQWDRLMILNSDLTLQKDWLQVLEKRWLDNPNDILVPMVTDDKTKMFEDIHIEGGSAQQVYEGVPGICLTLNKKQASAVYPIPEEVKVWFGDNWILGIMTALGEKIFVLDNFLAYHHHSTSVQAVEGVYEIIEQDKLAWDISGRHKMKNRVEELNNQISRNDRGE